MKKLALVLCFALAMPALAVSVPRAQDIAGIARALNGSPVYLGTIAATTSKTNSSTAVPFALTAGWLLLIQCDASAHLIAGSSVTVATGLKVAADEKFYLMLRTDQTALAVIDAANCAVFRVD